MSRFRYLLWCGPDGRGRWRPAGELAIDAGVDVEECLVVSAWSVPGGQAPTVAEVRRALPIGFGRPSERAAGVVGGWLRRLLGRQAPLCSELAAAVLCTVAAFFLLRALRPQRKES